MREIKFRAWNMYINLMCYDNEDLSSGYWDGIDSPVISLINSQFKLHKYVFQQFTGLLDKNGKEIYEGDLLKFSGGIGEVYFEETSLQFMIKNKNGGWGFVNGQRYEERPEYREYEVIGNIYENPELLPNN